MSKPSGASVTGRMVFSPSTAFRTLVRVLDLDIRCLNIILPIDIKLIEDAEHFIYIGKLNRRIDF
jgi:hypothetical protein